MNKNTIPFWAQLTSKLKFHSTKEQKIKEETMEESLGLGNTDTETRFRSYTTSKYESFRIISKKYWSPDTGLNDIVLLSV